MNSTNYINPLSTIIFISTSTGLPSYYMVVPNVLIAFEYGLLLV